MEEKTLNEIIARQNTIKELKELKNVIYLATDGNVEFTITTKQLYSFMDISVTKQKDKVNISSNTMNIILDEAIKREQQCIDRLIDAEVENKLQKMEKNKNS